MIFLCRSIIMKQILKRSGAFLAVMVLFCLCAAVFSSCGKIPGVSFSDTTLTYNGEEQKIEVAGLPEGATVESTTFKGSPKVPVAASRGSGYWKGMFTFE